ncbi:MAG: hypothetical protein PWQ09_77 [Candidatus Cloacimonadota bacterium]|nr:hypothetical protein [Candidatus Cloacimonadota bacterium]
MKKFFKTLVNVISWVLLLAAFSSMGFSSDDPAVGVPVFGVFFILVFLLVYLYTRNHQKHHEPNLKSVALVHRIFGIILIILGILSPLAIFNQANFPTSTNILILVIAAVLMALGALAVIIINNSLGKNSFATFLGYLLLIVLSAIPAFIVSQNDKIIEVFPDLYSALGMTYWATLAIAVFGWWGFSLLSSQNK